MQRLSPGCPAVTVIHEMPGIIPGIGSTRSIMLPATAEPARRIVHYQTRGMSR